MYNAKERITSALKHHKLDRIPMCETAIWPETIVRWESEGFPNGADPIDYFGLDRIVINHPFHCGFFDYVVYEENDEYVVDLNPYGTTVKYRKNANSSSGHQELDHKIKSMHDWQKAKQSLQPSEERFTQVTKPVEGDFAVISSPDHFWMSFMMCGMENLCCWLVEAPEEMRNIFNDYLDFYIAMLDLCVEKGLTFQALWFFSDMAYRSGPMFSPKTFRDVIAPGYRRLREWCNQNGKWMLLHTDGNVTALLPDFIDVGFDWVQPLEARAGNDIRELTEKYGDRIAFMGNINADVLACRDRVKIEDEIGSKITAAKEYGNYIYHVDHSVPPTISLETYTCAIELVRKYGEFSSNAKRTICSSPPVQIP